MTNFQTSIRVGLRIKSLKGKQDRRILLKSLRQNHNLSDVEVKIALLPLIFQKVVRILEVPTKFRFDDDIEWMCQLTKEIKFFKDLRKYNGIKAHKEVMKKLVYQQVKKDDVLFSIGILSTLKLTSPRRARNADVHCS